MEIKDKENKAAIIQNFFNKLKLSNIPDLSATLATETPDSLFTHYKTSIDQFTKVDSNRLQRYREYDQMVYVPELNAGLELYSDDATLINDEGNVIKVEADNSEVKRVLDKLFNSTLKTNNNLWKIIYNTCKYGDSFYEIIPDDFKNPRSVKHLRYIPAYYVSRMEKDGNLIKFLVRIFSNKSYSTSFSNVTTEISLLPWQIAHFKLEDDLFYPYGKSVLEPGRLAFKQMKLLEDALLIYRISRAPEKRVFRIPVGRLERKKAMKVVDDVKQAFRKTPWIDPQTGEISYKGNPLSINDDFFIPVRDDGTGIQIETLPGGQQLSEIDDVKLFKEKILRTMRIPLAYLTGEISGNIARNSLSSMDVVFAKTIERVQKMIIKTLEKIAIIELAFKRFPIEDMYNFKLYLTPPSQIYELQKMELLSTKLGVIQTALQLTLDENGKLYYPVDWLYRNISKLNDKEINDIKVMQQAEAINKQTETEGGGELPGGNLMGNTAVGAPVEAGGNLAAGEEIPAAENPEATAEGGEENVPAANPIGKEIQLASEIINVAGEEFLLENEEDIKKLIKFVKEYNEERKTHKTSKDKLKVKLYENNFDELFKVGELRGLIRRRNTKNNNQILND